MQKKYSINLAILFGSHAKGTTGRMSDLDIAILADRPLELEERGEIAESFAEQFKVTEDKIDLVDLWNASPLLQHNVATHGKLIKGDEYAFFALSSACLEAISGYCEI